MFLNGKKWLILPQMKIVMQVQNEITSPCHGSCPHEPSSCNFRFPVREDTNRGYLLRRVYLLYLTIARFKIY